jgi:hypothetical protein
MTTMTSAVLRLLEDGPGTSGELAAELVIGWRTCSANLHRLWIDGRIDRNAMRVRAGGQRGAPACLYGLIGAFASPDERPKPRPKRVRVNAKRIRPYKYRDRREYRRLRRQRLAGTSPGSRPP